MGRSRWEALLDVAAHRPWPLPARRWAMHMRWEDLLFAHWPLDPSAVAPRLPAGLALDTFDGAAWLGVVPFRMTDTGLRGLPPVPTARRFPELNVRTYVHAGGKPGVWFFSLDAASALAVAGARAWFHLPYFRARMSCERPAGGVIYASQRTHRGAPPLVFDATYRPVGAEFRSRPGSIEAWLTERYALYAADRRGRVFRGDIHHPPWPLRPAAAELRRNDGAAAHGFTLPDRPPLLHFAEGIDVVGWSPVPAGD